MDSHAGPRTMRPDSRFTPKELTGIVDLSIDENGQVRARLPDLVQGGTRVTDADWLEARGEDFTVGVEVATLDPPQGYKSAIDEELANATAVLDPPSTSSRSAPGAWTRPAGCSWPPPGTAAARAPGSTGSRRSRAPARRTSPTSIAPASSGLRRPRLSTRRST